MDSTTLFIGHLSSAKASQQAVGKQGWVGADSTIQDRSTVSTDMGKLHCKLVAGAGHSVQDERAAV